MRKKHVPYFYVIEHITTGKKYAGSRYAKGCNPNELLAPNGYKTSSKLVNSLIEIDGIESFRILDIVTEDDLNIPFCTNNVYDYETWFLIENDCAKSNGWLNLHNNQSNAFGTQEYNKLVLQKFGVANASQIDFVKQKKMKRSLEVYGTEYTLQAKEVKDSIVATNLEKYGVGCYFASDTFKAQVKTECEAKYGVSYHQSRPEIREKISISNKGKIFTKTHRENISKAKKNKILAKDLVTGQIMSIDKDLFYSDRNRYVGATKGRVNVKDIDGNILNVSVDDPKYISGEYVHMSKIKRDLET